MRRLLPFLLLLACSERGFREVVADDSDEPVSEAGPGPSDWDALDGEGRPEVLIAAVWSDRDATQITTTGPWRCPLSTAQVRYGFWDLEGRLVAEVDPPLETLRGSLIERVHGRAPGLSAAGPTSFLVVSEGAPGSKVAWLGDGVEGSAEVVLRWTVGEAWDGVLELPAAGETLELGPSAVDLRVHADPSEDRHVWLAVERVGAEDDDVPLLYRVDLDDPDRVASWTTDTLLTDFPRQLDVDGLHPGTLQVARHDGRLRVALDLAGQREEADRVDLVGPGIVVVFDPAGERVLWTQEISHAPSGPSAFAIGPDGELAWLGTAYRAVDGGLLANYDRSLTEPSGIGLPAEPDGRLACPATAALLDVPTGTAAFRAVLQDGDTVGDGVLLLTHRGERLLRVDALREGLRRTPFIVHEVVVVDGP